MIMSLSPDNGPRGQVDPRDLTAGQLAALKLVRDYRLSRVAGGWAAPGTKKVTQVTMHRLWTLRLTAHATVCGRPRVTLTHLGMNTLAVADARSARRQA